MEAKDLKTGIALKEISQNLILSQREKHLIGLSVTLTRGCDSYTTRRYKEAIDFGISKQELIDLTDLVAMTNAGVVLRTGLLSVSDSFDKDCKDDVCKVQ